MTVGNPALDSILVSGVNLYAVFPLIAGSALWAVRPESSGVSFVVLVLCSAVSPRRSKLNRFQKTDGSTKNRYKVEGEEQRKTSLYETQLASSDEYGQNASVVLSRITGLLHLTTLRTDR